jgi:hypothetical protein
MGSNPPFSASNSLDLELEKALLRGSFCLLESMHGTSKQRTTLSLFFKFTPC